MIEIMISVEDETLCIARSESVHTLARSWRSRGTGKACFTTAVFIPRVIVVIGFRLCAVLCPGKPKVLQRARIIVESLKQTT